ncbi:phospholipase D family protein [Thioclava atlantica]|uniref:Phospholipase D n=1 Tax=Thioclava atlantica TaxID=1317124 RepID=A0A085TX03_9RHOB|nr:phospholipase D family protein [Thioclava atlantica]KFE35250.1 phospholipase D/transphosphatidylase [Thioclava atlantica]
MERLKRAGIRAESRVRSLLTAAEAYPALENAFLDARQSIHASFRIFDPQTKLRSPRGREIGRTWFDLLLHVLKRGVEVRIDLCDFDPCARPEMHRQTWSSIRMLCAARELAGPKARLRSRALMHPAQSGLVPRIGFWPLVWRKLGSHAQWLNDMTEAQRRAALRDMPGLAEYLELRGDGAVGRKFGRLPRLFPATHHQKLAVFDGKQLYIGGLDLDERRYDTPRHERDSSETWHDLQLMITGPIVREAKAHLENFHECCAGTAEAEPPRRLLRTLSRARPVAGFHIGPRAYRSEIESAHEMLIARARQMIYLETQYFRSRSLARHLARAAQANPRLGLILMLPSSPEELAFADKITPEVRYGEFLQARAIETLMEGFGSRLFVGCPAQPRSLRPAEDGDGRTRGAPLVYVHAKVSIFDDEAALVSSANLNGRSLRWDSEAGVYLRRTDGIEALRHRVMRHWLPDEAEEAFFDPTRAVSAWAELARANASQPPEERRGFIMPYPLEASKKVGRRLPFIPEEMV